MAWLCKRIAISPVQFVDILICWCIECLKRHFSVTAQPMRRNVIRLHGWLSIRLIWSAKRKKPLGQSQLTKIIEYLERFTGQTFTGVVSSVSTFGLMVRLECTATGSLAIEDLGEEYFSYDPERQMLNGASTGVRYRLGQTIQVVLVSAKPRERRLRFKLATSYE